MPLPGVKPNTWSACDAPAPNACRRHGAGWSGRFASARRKNRARRRDRCADRGGWPGCAACGGGRTSRLAGSRGRARRVVTRHGDPHRRHSPSQPGDLVPEVIVGEVEEIGFSEMARARAGVDRDPKPLAATFEQDVIVRTLAPGLRLPVDDSAAEEAVAPDSHTPRSPRHKRRPPRDDVARRSFCRIWFDRLVSVGGAA